MKPLSQEEIEERSYRTLMLLQKMCRDSPIKYVNAVWAMRYPPEHQPSPKWNWPITIERKEEQPCLLLQMRGG
jgi:hypothetical protein